MGWRNIRALATHGGVLVCILLAAGADRFAREPARNWDHQREALLQDLATADRGLDDLAALRDLASAHDRAIARQPEPGELVLAWTEHLARWKQAFDNPAVELRLLPIPDRQAGRVLTIPAQVSGRFVHEERLFELLDGLVQAAPGRARISSCQLRRPSAGTGVLADCEVRAFRIAEPPP